eukprot:4789370-Pyramimonas_sp.AAC.1
MQGGGLEDHLGTKELLGPVRVPPGGAENMQQQCVFNVCQCGPHTVSTGCKLRGTIYVVIPCGVRQAMRFKLLGARQSTRCNLIGASYAVPRCGASHAGDCT